MAPSDLPKVGKRKLGSQGLEVSDQGFGCMGLSFAYGKPQAEADAVATLKHAIASGITFLDTSDAYGPHTNEVIVGKAIADCREKVQLATKFGITFGEGGGFEIKGHPEYIRKACEASLERLNTPYIDLYYMHRVDKNIPIEVSVGEMKKLVQEGKVKYIGLSEASASDIRRAHHVHPISAVQIEWSLWTRDVEDDIIPVCRELGIGIVPYSPLGRGFFSGKAVVEDLEEGDNRKGGNYPRFLPENLEKNKIFYERLRDEAKPLGLTPGQLALAWVQNQGDDVVPIPGTTSVKHLDENIRAVEVKLSREQVAKIADLVKPKEVAGERYNEKLTLISYKHVETPPLQQYTI